MAVHDKATRSLYRAAANRTVNELVTKAPRRATARANEQVGTPPEGFGGDFEWDRSDEQIVLVTYLNAADPLGITIRGLQRGDRVEVTRADGIASFSKADSRMLRGIIGLVGAGAAGTVGELGHPEAAKAIAKATDYAREMFDQGEVKTMRRDAFGLDPGTGHRARAEGGVLVTMPGAVGAYYSNGKLKDRWLKGHKPRSDDQRPAHVRNGFFLVDELSHNTRTVSTQGIMGLIAWDHKFEDNAGFYKVILRITRGTGGATFPPVD